MSNIVKFKYNFLVKRNICILLIIFVIIIGMVNYCVVKIIKFVIICEKEKIPTCIWLSRQKRASNSIFYQDEWIVLAAKKHLTNDETLMYACQWRPDPRRRGARGGHELYER